MRKLGFVCLALLLAAGTLGVVYSSWSQNLNTNATVSIAQAPAVVASGANAGTTSATLNGSLTQTAPGNAAVSVGFQYWDATTPGSVITVPAGSVSSLNSTFSATVTGLTSGHNYVYQSTGVGFFTVNSANTSTFTTDATLRVTTGSLPGGPVGVPYSQTIQASGGSGSYTSWTISSGSLPTGLSLHSGNIISGIPTTVNSYSFTVQVNDGSNPPQTAVSGSLTIVISNAPSKLAFGQQPSSTTPGTAFSPTITVNVEDPSGATVTTSSATVSITIANNPSGGTLSGMQTVNAVNGVATFSNLNIDKAGTGYTLTTSSAGLTGATSGSFDITPRTTNQLSLETAANGTGILISAQSITAGTGGTVTAYAIERDASGTFIANVAGTWSLANITGGIVSSELVPAGDSKSSVFTSGTAAGSSTIHVVWDGISADSGTITLTAGTAAKLAFTTQPGTSSLGGVAFTTQPVVTVEDTYGNTVTSPGVSITLAIGTNPSAGTLTVSGGNPISSTNGVAAFSGVSIDKAGTGYTLTATGGSLTSATSTAFNITVSAEYHLVFTQQPSGGAASSSFGTQPQVTVKDTGGNIMTNYSGTVLIAITSGTGTTGATLSATTNPLTVVSGVAAFTGVSINWAGTGYTLTATSGNLTATSNSFNITAITRTWTGTGTSDNFSTANHWTGNSVPGAGDNLIIVSPSTYYCNFDNAANNFVYTTLTLGNVSTPGTLQWPVAGNNTLQVTNIIAANTSGTSQILMPTGNTGILQVTGTTTVGSTFSISCSAGTQNFNGAVTINSGGVITETAPAALSFGSNLTINTGGALTESGATTISIAGTLSGTGGLTNLANGTLNISGACSITTLTNAGTITVTGSGNITTAIASFTNTGILNLNGSGTIAGITNNAGGIVNLSSSGTIASFNNATSTSTLNISALTVPTITTLTVSNAGNTVNYSGAGAQTVIDVAYSNLTTSGSGIKTWTEGAARVMGGNLQVSDGTTLSVAGGFAWTVTGTSTMGNGASGILSITNATGTKTFTGAVTINSGATLSESAAATLSFGSDVTINGTLTENGAAIVGIAGNLTNNSTYTASTGVHTFSGSGKTIGGTNTVTIPTATFTGAYANSGTLTVGTLLTVTGVTLTNNGTITASTALAGTGILTNTASHSLNIGGTCSIGTLTNAGTVTVTNGGAISTVLANFTNTGILNLGGSGTIAGITNNAAGIVNLSSSGTITSFNNATATSTLNISAATVPITTLTTATAGNTVNYTGTGQTLKVNAYSNLILSGSGAETFGAITTVTNLTLNGTATAITGANLAISSNLIINSGTTFTIGANFTLGVTGTTSITGTYTDNSTGAKTLTGDVTINSGGVWNEMSVSAYSIAGNFTNTATTFSANTGIHTFSGASKTIGGSTTTSIGSIAVTGTYTNNGTLTVGTALSGAGTLTNGASGTLNIGGTCSITTLSNSGTVTSSGTGTTTSTTLTNIGIFNMGSTGTVTTFTNAAAGILNITGTVPAITTLTVIRR